jgi:polyvinyl alcohol dehydrogenase (cytochrome)
MLRSFVPASPHRGSCSHRRLALGIANALALVLALPLAANGPGDSAEWTMIGQDVANTRSQPAERRIGPRNVEQLAPKWVLTTGGDVSATPAVIIEDGGRRHRGRRTVAFFPDWSGWLWKVDAESGHVIWAHRIADYTGTAGAISRTSPAYAGGMIFIGDLNGNMMAVDARTGKLRWLTELDPNPNTIVTTSPIVHGNRLYISTSSSGGGPGRMIFRGSLLALDIRTGEIIWQSYALPDNGGVPGGFAGGAFVNPPAIDLENGLIYGAAGQLYTEMPASVMACLAAAPGGWSERCFPAGAYFNSLIAFDLETGTPRWSFRGAGPKARELACGPQPASWCPAWEGNFSVWDFAGAGANVFRARVHGRWRDMVGIGEKSGVYWAFDARTGKLVWATLVGHGDDPGGIQWGSAVDGRRIYVAIGHTRPGVPYDLPSGETITGGSWAALDPGTGRILWQTADPQGASDLAALTVANGVVYAGSMAHTGNQMYALSARSGRILWEYAAGGSVVSGPAVVDGTVFWGSGYARTGGVGNDQFYAFSIGGR